jgi:putative ABC transport system permease protein
VFRNYFKTALQNFKRHKSNSIINIAGLTVGFAAFILIFIVIQYEKSFDNFHPDKNSIYRVVRIGKNITINEYRAGVPFPVSLGLRTEFPQLKNAAAVYTENNSQVDVTAPDGSVLKKFKEPIVFVAESNFFKMFNFPLAQGNIATVINDPNTVLLTKDVASKYFGEWRTAVGKTIKVFGLNMKVTGILENPPANTDLPLSVVVSYETLVKNSDMNDWSSISDRNYCFVQLDKSASPGAFNKLIAKFVDKHIKPVNPNYDLSLQPLDEMHFDARYGNFTGATFSKDLILALSLIGLFLLIIACVNFINLTTAQAVNRAREVGVRKVLGSRKAQLVWQFLGETGVTVLLSLLSSLLVVVICIPFVNNLLGIHLSTSTFYEPSFIVFLICLGVLVTFLSGFYPALVLSAFKSVNVLKGALLSGNQKGLSLRRGLVVFQFVIAQILIISTQVVVSQMDYFRNADMGFAKNAVINVGIPGDSLSRTKIDLLRNELKKVAGIESVSFSAFAPSSEGGWYTDLVTPTNKGASPEMIVSMKPADTTYFDLYNLELVAGRRYYPSDTVKEFVVNETVIRNLGIKNAQAAIGKEIIVAGRRCPIVGVVKDFHVNSLRDPIRPVVLTTMRGAYGLSNIKVDLKQAQSVIKSMQAIWNSNFTDFVFEYHFLDQSIADYYKQENQLSKLYKIFSGIAIFISCLGLYGLVAFMAVQRKKEIGIRKVLGAPVRDIVIMLSREFTILIVVAFLIASPIAWYYMHEWLQQYTFRIAMGAWFFVGTVVMSLVIAWLTVGYTAIKAAMANPVRSLRTE